MNMKKNLIDTKKRILAYITTTTLGISLLTGCSEDIKYTTNENGVVEINDDFSHNFVSKLKFIRLSNSVVNKDSYFLVDSISLTIGRGPNVKYYNNIENGVTIYEDGSSMYENFSVDIIIDNMEDYLYKYDMIKESYNLDDIKLLKENLLNDSSLNITNGNKKLVK